MHTFTALTVVTALSLPFLTPRATQPNNWPTFLENWNTYHARYLAEDCDTKHGTTYFDECCNPLLAIQTIADLPSLCSSGDGVDDENGDECDDGDDGDETTPTKAAPSPAVSKNAASTRVALSSDFITGGNITYYYQNNTAGACGKVHSDEDLICALQTTRYGNGSLCWHQILIEADNNRSVIVTVADDCPTCKNENCIDLSVKAFEAMALLSVGDMPVKWRYLN